MLVRMSRNIVVTLEFGREAIAARSRIGDRDGLALAWEAPQRAEDDPAFCATAECEAFILDALAVMHHANVDLLVLALPPGEVEAHAGRLGQACTGRHAVRDTECRSQRLAIHVRRVEVVGLEGGA